MIQKLRMNFESIYLMTGRALFFELLHAAQIGAVQSFSLPQIALSRKASDLQWQFVSAASSGKQIRYNRKLRRKKNLKDTVAAFLLLLSAGEGLPRMPAGSVHPTPPHLCRAVQLLIVYDC